jgi:hypothetical protein
MDRVHSLLMTQPGKEWDQDRAHAIYNEQNKPLAQSSFDEVLRALQHEGRALRIVDEWSVKWRPCG